MRRTLSYILAVMLMATAARAEYRQVEFSIFGMD